MTTTRRRILAILTAAATLAGGLAFGATANAAETAASLTLNAGTGETLAGHTFKAYRIGTWKDVVTNATNVTSFGVQLESTKAKTWVEAAITAANAKLGTDKITIPNGYDAAGAIAKMNDTNTADMRRLRELAKQLAATAANSGVTTVAFPASTTGTVKATVNEGLYLITDSNGNPMIIPTTMNGKSFADRTLGVALVKGKGVKVTKTITNTGNLADQTKKSAGVLVGDTVTQKLVLTIPNGKVGGALKFKIVDAPSKMSLVTGTLIAKTWDGTTVRNLTVGTDVILYQTAGQKVAGDATLLAADGKTRTDPDLTVPNGGFILDATKLLTTHPGRQLVIEYKAKVTAAGTTSANGASNTATVNGTFSDGVQTVIATASDKTTMLAFPLTITKTDNATGDKLNGAKFQVQDTRDNTWLTYDYATGRWTRGTDQSKATTFVSGDTNHDGVADSKDTASEKGKVTIPNLGASTYLIKEIQQPSGYSSIAKPTFKATISDTGATTITGVDNPNLSVKADDRNVTVKNIKSITELPDTGGVLAVMFWVVCAIPFLGLALIGAIRGGMLRRQGR
ncbi:SpaA isopeptide-forming pilin-related protein [Bifidobacterium sp. SO1]|uniref:SpaA isopeptide-forming pilin-related protein n=1 Tax=Bifidobacterium sp. SO1 TaxID=2809029 RepID=UPI001BDC67AE|nr:SpaA isopeptide-forming pilin-related protein [Bifidobacterium sp. SO1]MBT1161807.1 hypothetical protein [Bifidobacterium sp. SO1]